MRSSDVGHPGPHTSWLFYWIGRLWMKAFGWDVEGDPPAEGKAVIIAAPHTSNWDFPHMMAASFVYRMKIGWLGKDSLFKPPLGWLLRWLGGIAIDRSSRNKVVDQVADRIREADALYVAVPPSGTRSKRDHWKSGFYWIALSAQVPIVCGFLDYERRRAGFGPSLVPSGDLEADMDRLRAFYEPIRGKFPEQQTTIVLRDETTKQPEPEPVGAAPDDPEAP